jgi:hypothetical protein
MRAYCQDHNSSGAIHVFDPAPVAVHRTRPRHPIWQPATAEQRRPAGSGTSPAGGGRADRVWNRTGASTAGDPPISPFTKPGRPSASGCSKRRRPPAQQTAAGTPSACAAAPRTASQAPPALQRHRRARPAPPHLPNQSAPGRTKPTSFRPSTGSYNGRRWTGVHSNARAPVDDRATAAGRRLPGGRRTNAGRALGQVRPSKGVHVRPGSRGYRRLRIRLATTLPRASPARWPAEERTRPRRTARRRGGSAAGRPQ